MNISLSLLFTVFTYFTYFQGISYKKSRAYPSVFSAEPVSRYAKVPCYAHHCYKKDKFQMNASLFWLFLILSDSAISKKFLVKKVRPIPRVSLQNLSVKFLKYLPMHTIVIQKSQASDEYIFILAFYLFLAIFRFLRNFL